MPGARLIVTVDGNSQMGAQFIGDETALMELMGALEYSKVLLIERIRKTKGEFAWGKTDGISQMPIVEKPSDLSQIEKETYPTEQKLPKVKAIEATEYAINALQMRIQKMKDSPNEAEFVINPSLLAQL